MAISHIKAVIPYEIHRVWDVVTAVDRYTWRSDLSRTEVRSDRQFIEYTQNGYPTTFTVTVSEPCRRWEFDLENSRMRGHWIGLFLPKGDETELEFTETVTAKSFLLRPLLKPYLKKQQARFVDDLEQALRQMEQAGQS